MRLTLLLTMALSLAFPSRAQNRHSDRSDPVLNARAPRKVRDSILMDSLKQKVAYWKSRHQTNELLATLRLYATQCFWASRYDALLQSGRDMKDLAGIEHNKFYEAISMINIGNAFLNKNQLDSASYYQFKALQLGTVLQHDSLVAEAYACLGGIYIYRKEFSKSLEFCEKAVQYAEKWHTSKELMVIGLGCKAIALTWLKRYPEAIQVDLKALPMAQALSRYDFLITLKMNLARNYLSLGKYSSARGYLEELEQEMPLYDLSYFYFTANMAILGMTYGDMHDRKKAISVLLKQIPAAKELNHIDLLQRIYESLSAIAEDGGQYKEALAYSKSAQYYQSLVQQKNNDQLFSELEVRFQTAEKEKALSQKGLQLAQKDLQLQKSRYYMYYTLTGLVVALLLTALLYLHSRYKKGQHHRELNSIRQQKELQLLHALMQGEERERSRIAKDLHDGVAGMLAAVKMHFSSMPAADYLSGEEGYRQGMYLLNEAAQEIRKTSHNLMPEVLLQHGLDEALRRYCHSAHNSRTLQIQYDSWGQIDRFSDSFELSVYRIVQELVNNIIKHSRATQAIVQVSQQQKVLSISIEDNGVGFVGEHTGDGMGLHSLQSRVQAMNGRLEVLSGEQSGVSAYLEFDIAELTKETASADDKTPPFNGTNE